VLQKLWQKRNRLEVALLKPLFAVDDEMWVEAIGRFMLNMGAIEAASMYIDERIEDRALRQQGRKDLTSRLGFIRKHFPRTDKDRHSWAMNVLGIAVKIATFRDAIAHSPLVCSVSADGAKHIHGILDVKQNQLISLEELKRRVDESARVASGLLEMQGEFHCRE
jgi:hypothetical protein